MPQKERRATKAERQEIQRLLAQARLDEEALARMGVVYLHDRMYDAVLLGTAEKAAEGRPIDPANLRPAMALLYEHSAMTNRTVGAFECVQCWTPFHSPAVSPMPQCKCGCRQVRLRAPSLRRLAVETQITSRA